MSSIQWNNRTSALEVCQYFKHEIQGRVILITGPTITGVGYATALAIAKAEPKRLILAGRSVGKLEESRDAILRECPGAQLKLLTLDLGDLEAVRQSAKEVLGWEEPIDVLIHNAAVLTLLLLPNILSSHSKRIVNVSSAGHGNGSIRFKDPDFKDEEYNRKEAYGQSKTGMILVARQLARLYASKGLTAFSLDPGGISTPLQQHWSLEEKQDIGRKYGAYHEDGTVNTDCQVWKTTDQGASTTCRAAFDPDLVNGSYLVDAEVAEDKCRDYAKDMALAEKTWGWLEGLAGQKAE